MDKAAAGDHAGSGSGREPGRWAAAALACSVIAPLAWGQEAAPLDLIAADMRPQAPLRLEVNTSTLPRIEAQDTGFQAPRIDVSLLPPRRSAVGVAFGMSSAQPRPGAGLLPLGAARASMDFGLHFRQTLQRGQLDLTAWRRMTSEPDAYTLVQQRQPVYGARVEMSLAPARKSGFNIDRGLLGFQLESGAKISIKRKDGRPMIYYRNTF